jgi:hypothetical protein
MLSRSNAISPERTAGVSHTDYGLVQETARAKRFGFLCCWMRRDIDSIGIVQLGDREPMKSRGVLIQIATSLKIQLTTE